MTDFDYGALWDAALAEGPSTRASAAYLREQIEAAFVERAEYDQLVRQHDGLQDTAQGLREALVTIKDITQKRGLPVTNDVYEVARQALGDAQ